MTGEGISGYSDQMSVRYILNVNVYGDKRCNCILGAVPSEIILK